MRRFYALGALLFAFAIGKSQETLPYYQQYLLDGGFLFNPALYGATDKVSVNLNYQKQYANFKESPNVQSIGMNANVVDRVGAGFHVFRDSNGPISANGITAGASYTIPLGDGDERKDQFSFGTSASAYNMTFDLTKINANSNDPLLQGDTNSLFLFYANFGLAASYKKVFANVSVNDIALTNDRPIANGIEPSPIKIFLNAGYDWHFAENMYVTPSVLINLNTDSSRLTDYNITGTFYNDNNAFTVGASYRMGQNRFGNQNLSISPLIKAHIGGLTFGAVYNIGMSEIQNFGGNSFMVSLGYNFDNFINTRGFRY